ncbi:MAG: DUF1552 domain-containing protein, partial [Verrucomicrobiota bacterium]
MKYTRRTFLAGTGGVMFSPVMSAVFDGLRARAAGNVTPPLRFIFIVNSNGLWAENIKPIELLDRLPFDPATVLSKGKGAAESRKGITPAAELTMEPDLTLSAPMKPLEPFRDRMSILQGINSGFGVYHSGQYQTLGAFQGRRRNSREIFGPTVDALLARAFAGPVPHVCLGHDSKAPSGVSYIPTSADGVGKPIPFYTKPARAYKELFGVVGQGAVKDEYNTHSDILDFFVDDTKRLRSEVAGPERDQLDRYLNAFESVRKSRRDIEAMGERLRRHAPPPPGELDVGDPARIAAGHIDIATAALISGLTNVVTIRFDLLGSTT